MSIRMLSSPPETGEESLASLRMAMDSSPVSGGELNVRIDITAVYELTR